jgi:protein-S-isoprenylcysteine O-methyltransferase Ste14
LNTLFLLLRNLVWAALAWWGLVVWLPLNWFERRADWGVAWSWGQWAALALFLPGAAVGLYCLALFVLRGQGTLVPFDPPRKFIRRGPYKWVRNPLYLALLAQVGALGLFLRSWHIGVYWVCLACAVNLFVLLYEENALRFRFGAIYEDYKRDVPRWLPRKPKPMLETVAPIEPQR